MMKSDCVHYYPEDLGQLNESRVRASRQLLPLQASEQLASLELFRRKNPGLRQTELIVKDAKIKQRLEISPA
jgi:hypothetical protein